MRYQVIHLKGAYPFLCNEKRDPILTIYLPDNLSEMGRQVQIRPCLLICPGGGYAMCSQREAEPVALHFLPEGYNVFVLTYSVAPNQFPAQLCEVAAAMELIHSNAEAWHCDRSQIAIMGFSAGGHLAAQYSNCYDWPEVRQYFPDSKPVHASILCYPVISAASAVAHLGSFENLLGHSHLTQEEITRFSCDLQVTKRTPPSFLWHTAPDDCVPVMNSLLYAKALAAHGVPFELHVYPCGWHGLSTVDEQTNEPLEPEVTHAADWLEAAKKWLDITFGKKNSAGGKMSL